MVGSFGVFRLLFSYSKGPIMEMQRMSNYFSSSISFVIPTLLDVLHTL